MCCHHHRRRQNGPVSLLFSTIRAQIQAQSLQQGEKLPTYTSTRTVVSPLNAQTTGTIAATPYVKPAPRWESSEDVLPPPPTYEARDHVTHKVNSSASMKAQEARVMTPEERIAFGQEYITDYLSARPRVAETAEAANRGVGQPEHLSRWELKLQRKMEKYARKVEKKAEKYARKAARHAERHAERG